MNNVLGIDTANVSPSGGDSWVYNSVTQLWEPKGVVTSINGSTPTNGDITLNLGDLNDVVAVTPSKGQAIIWDGTQYVLKSIPYRIGSNAVNVASTTTTSEQVLHTWTIGANEFSTSAHLRIIFLVQTNNNINIKRFRVRVGGLLGTEYFNVNFGSVVSNQVISVDIYANGTTNAQVGHGSINATRSGSTTSAIINSAINTTASWTVVLTSQKNTAADTVTIRFAEMYLFN